MAWSISIGGVIKPIQLQSLNVSQIANGVGPARFRVYSADGSDRAVLDAEVLIVEDSVRIYGGVVSKVRELGVVQGYRPGIITEIDTVDFNTYVDRRTISMAIPGGSLLSILQVLEPVFTPFGVTLDAGQVTGPTLPDLAYTIRTGREVLDDIAKLTAAAGEPFTWAIDAFKHLRMFQPSTVAAPFDLTGYPIREVIGDIVVEAARDSSYANRITVYIPPILETNRIETFIANGTADAFVLQYTLVGWFPRGVIGVDAGNETVSPVGQGGQWEFDTTTNTLTRVIGPPTAGAVITAQFDGTYTVLVDASDAGEIAAVGPWEKVYTLDALPTGTTAQDLADAYLAKAVHVTQTVRYTTRHAGLRPGMSQAVVVPLRNINATAVVTDVVIRDDGTPLLRREVIAVIDASQTNLDRGWRTVYTRWLTDTFGVSGNRSSAVVAGPGTPPTGASGAAPPVLSVQFNRAGALGGDASFTYEETTHSVVCGLNSSITAADPESCQVFGEDNHIE